MISEQFGQKITIFVLFIGLLKLIGWIFHILSFLKKHFFTFKYDLADRYGSGSWVFITGGSSGIGEEFAMRMASFGFNLILVARTDQTLRTAR